jgi:hypothetical protein
MRTCLLALCCLVLASCDTAEPLVFVPSGQLSFRVNDQLWTSALATARLSTFDEDRDLFMLSGSTPVGGGALSMFIASFFFTGEGVYELDFFGGGVFGSMSFVPNSSRDLMGYSQALGSPARIEVTRYDADEQRVSGTFEGTLVKQTFNAQGSVVLSDTVRITEGAFDVRVERSEVGTPIVPFLQTE